MQRPKWGLWVLALAVIAAVAYFVFRGKPPAAPVATKPEAPKIEPQKDTRVAIEKPRHVRGIYLTAWSAGSTRKMDAVFGLLGRTELNALVIDVRDAGIVYFKTGIPLADESGATRVAVRDPKALMARLVKHKAYPIARIACFRDTFVPKKHPELAVQNINKRLWKDSSGHTWLDPFNKKNWEYLAEIVDYALDIGFPEIQLDYVRFPSEGTKVQRVFPAKKGYFRAGARRQDVIADFASFIGGRVRARHAVFSADLFGIISSAKTDQGIGQSLEEVAAPFDVICPMVYPSHFARGEYGIANPNASPHAIVLKSLRDFSKRLPNKPIRPWLQDFTLGFPYTKVQVQAQIKACKEMGYEEYLLWNARNVYTEAAVVDNSRLVVRNQPPPSGRAEAQKKP